MVNLWFNYVLGGKPWLIRGLTVFGGKPWLIRGLTMFLVVKPWLISGLTVFGGKTMVNSWFNCFWG